jgi:N-methylhydantoinase A
LLVAPPRLDFARSLLVPLDQLDWDAVENLFVTMEAEAMETLESMGISSEEVVIERGVDARYVNQGHEFAVPLPAGLSPDNARDSLREAFETVYTRLFGRTVPGVPIECVTWRTTVRGRDGDLPAAAIAGNKSSEPRSLRPVYFRSGGKPVEAPVYRRDALRVGSTLSGPAIVEEAQSTLVVGPGDHFEADRHGNIIVHVAGGVA